MLGFYISLPFLLFALYRLFVVLYNYFSRPLLPAGTPVDNPLVSILVYVQSSEKSIGRLLQGIKEQTHQNFEVLIYNNQSTDKTVDVISEVSAGDKRYRLFNGSEVKTGWQSKNNAYDKLTQIAKGQYYIFINSDNTIDNQFIANALSHMQRKSLSLLTIYPKPQSQNFGIKLKISAAQWMFFSLVLVKSFFRKRAGGMSILMNPLIISEANSYQSNRWHEKFKDDAFPETKIADAIDGLNLNSDSLLGDNRFTCDVTELNIEVTELIKNRNGFIAYSLATTLGLFLAIFLLPFPLVFLYLFAIIYARMLIAMLCQQSVILSLLIMPIQYFVLVKGLIIAIKKSGK